MATTSGRSPTDPEELELLEDELELLDEELELLDDVLELELLLEDDDPPDEVVSLPQPPNANVAKAGKSQRDN